MKSESSTLFGKNCIDDENTIFWDFVSGDPVSHSARVSLGDTDPLTGKILDNPEIFAVYRRDKNTERRKQAAYRIPKKEGKRKHAEVRNTAKAEIRQQFLDTYGYEPSAGTLQYLLEQQRPLDALLSLEADPSSSCLKDCSFTEASFEAVSDDIEMLREYVSSLNPMQHDIYSAMLLKYEGGGLWITDAELAEKWGVHPTSILYERKKIIAGIRRAVAEGRR